MCFLVNAAMSVEGVFRRWKHGIKVGLPHVAVEAIDLVEGGIAVYREAIGSEADELALQSVSGLNVLCNQELALPYFS